MTAEARRAITVIRQCIKTDRFTLTIHFSKRMSQRGLFWLDVQAVIYEPSDVRAQKTDEYGRQKWIIRGEAVVGGDMEIVCAIEMDETETEFITLYWDD